VDQLEAFYLKTLWENLTGEEGLLDTLQSSAGVCLPTCAPQWA
jgi:hypothetical protein